MHTIVKLIVSVVVAALLGCSPLDARAAGPTTPILDDFTGTDGTSLTTHDGNWTLIKAGKNIQIKTNRANGTVGGDNFYLRGNTTYGPNSEAYFTYGVDGIAGQWLGLALRQSTLDAATTDGYGAWWGKDFYGPGDDQLSIQENTDDVYTTITGSTVHDQLVVGDQYIFRAVGSTLSVYHNGALASSASDGTHSAAGYIGVDLGNTNASDPMAIDGFGGGTYVAPCSRTLMTLGVGC